ncbi:MAG: ABC transporter permease [Anaeromyxobacteraceae bacterium]
MTALVDTIAMALATLRANPLRSALTLLGIVIGGATVVAMMSFTEGLRIAANTQFSMLGSAAFHVQRWPVLGTPETDRAKILRRKFLTREMGEALKTLPHVAYVSIEAYHPRATERLWTRERSTRPNIDVTGGTPGYEQANGVTVARGRFLSDVDLALGRRVMFVGADVADVLFPRGDALGQEVRLRNDAFTIIGVAERQGSILGQSKDAYAVVPIEAYYAATGKVQTHAYGIAATSGEDLPLAIDEVTTTLRRLRGVPEGAENDFELFTNDTFTKTFNDIAAVVAAATFGVCALALLVGGIGIMNIMLVSVTERTREIGVRMALGARRRRILAQFVVEAIALSLLGGLLGVLLGAGVAAAARELYDVPASIPAWAVILSLASASGCGLVFGIYPAARASRLDPVEAMRTE